MSGPAETAASPAPDGIRLEDPELLERYNGIDPALAKRALEQALAERERKVAAERETGRRQALRADTLAAMLAFAAAGYVAGVARLAGAGKPWIGLAAFAGGFLLWYLLAGRR